MWTPPYLEGIHNSRTKLEHSGYSRFSNKQHFTYAYSFLNFFGHFFVSPYSRDFVIEGVRLIENRESRELTWRLRKYNQLFSYLPKKKTTRGHGNFFTHQTNYKSRKRHNGSLCHTPSWLDDNEILISHIWRSMHSHVWGLRENEFLCSHFVLLKVRLSQNEFMKSSIPQNKSSSL